MSDLNSYIHYLKNKVTLLQYFKDKIKGKVSDTDLSSYDKCLQQVRHLLDQAYLAANGKENSSLERIGVNELNLVLLESLRDLNILHPEIIFNYDYDKVEAILDFSIDFEKKLFFQVLDNLASNSVKANADMVEYTLSLGDEGLHVTVRDNGSMDNYKNGRVNGMIPKGQGMGIIQKNMNLMKGSASMLNTKNEGFLVNLFFPRIP